MKLYKSKFEESGSGSSLFGKLENLINQLDEINAPIVVKIGDLAGSTPPVQIASKIDKFKPKNQFYQVKEAEFYLQGYLDSYRDSH